MRFIYFKKKVFKHSYIPYTMDDVVDIERDFRRAKQGETLIYTTLHGLKTDLSQPALMPNLLNEDNSVKSHDQNNNENKNEKEELNEEESSDEEEISESDQTDSENEDDQDNSNDSANKTLKTSKYERPRDESPNSRRVC